MYITKTEGPGFASKTPKKLQQKSKSDSTFEETVVTLLADAVELTNPNDDRPRHDAPQHDTPQPSPDGAAEEPVVKKGGISISA